MNKRHFFQALRIVKNTRFNADLLRYAVNKCRATGLKMRKSPRVAYPSAVMLELGNHCNLHCSICPREYSYGKSMDKGYMDLNRAYAIIDEIYAYSDSIGLTGLGETLLYPHLVEVASYIKSKKRSVVISLSTNANIPDFVNKALEVMPYVNTIQISVDGVGDIYETIRKPAKFDVLKENLRKIIPAAAEYDVDLMFNTVITKENYSAMSDILLLADELGIRYLNFNYFNLASVTDVDSSYYEFYSGREFKDALASIKSIIPAYPDVYVTGLDFPGNPSFRKCPFPWSHFYITWDGYMAPCCAKPFPKELNFGNVFDNGVIDALNSDGFISFRKLWYANHVHPFCNKCEFVEL